MKRRPIVLTVLDGWGHREEREHNAILTRAHHFQSFRERYPHCLLSASGREVGLPLGLMGNSEVGHTSLGAGRVVYQDITRIDKSIETGEFAANATLLAAVDRAREEGGALHLVGLYSDGGVHSSDRHLRALLELARARDVPSERVFVHAILDGRDTPPRSGVGYLEVLERELKEVGVGRIASVIGRYWAMDRDKRWERVQRAFELFVCGEGRRASVACEAVRASFAEDTGDEFVEPVVIGAPDQGRIADGHSVLCFNYRSDRMRELCLALGSEDFEGFERRAAVRPVITTMTQYRADFPFPIAYPPIELSGIFPELISAAGLRQKRVAETEKYAHVTFFFSGGVEDEYPGESRILVPSPKVATYDLQPEMSAYSVRDRLLESLREDETDVYIVNFANADMGGHTGMLDAALEAITAIDECLGAIVPEVAKRGGVCAITADHGNAELMWDDEHDQPHTAHTTSPVPMLFCGDDLVGAQLRPMGTLADVAPTLLELAGLQPSAGMDGVSLLQSVPTS